MAMASSGIQNDVAELAGIAAEGPLFGIFLVLDIAAIYILVARRRSTRLNIPLLVAAILMMLLAFAQFIVDTTNIFTAFISLGGVGRDARNGYLEDVTQPIFAAKHAIYFTMMLVGDAIVIYRCYVVWNSILVVIVPILCSLGSGASAYQTIWAIRHFPTIPNPKADEFEHQMGFAVFSLSFAANTIATSLLAYKIWKGDQAMRKSLPPQLRMSKLPIIRLVVESGAVNTAYLLVYTIVLSNGTNAIEIVACIVTPLVGIIFATVIIRASLLAESQAKSLSGHAASPHRFPGISAQSHDQSLGSQELTVLAMSGSQKLQHKLDERSFTGPDSV